MFAHSNYFKIDFIMSGNITFSMIKPCAISRNYTGNIIQFIIEHGFKIIAMKMIWLSREEAEKFYEIHKERPFYEGLVRFISSAPIIAAILEKENAVGDFRTLIGNTDPAKATQGTIRASYGTDIQQNAVHGSDSDENAQREANFFFSSLERFY